VLDVAQVFGSRVGERRAGANDAGQGPAPRFVEASAVRFVK
jgi:hypothetical protein